MEKALLEAKNGVDNLRIYLGDPETFAAPDIDDCEQIAEHIDRLENALLSIASMTQSTNLLWWQEEARRALGIETEK